MIKLIVEYKNHRPLKTKVISKEDFRNMILDRYSDRMIVKLLEKYNWNFTGGWNRMYDFKIGGNSNERKQIT